MLHFKIRVRDGFSVSKVTILMLQIRNMENHQKKIEDMELQALFKKDDSQTQKAIWSYSKNCF
jgi:hypothetical protein